MSWSSSSARRWPTADGASRTRCPRQSCRGSGGPVPLRNEIQALSIPEDAMGEFACVWNGTATAVVPVATVTKEAIAKVLNELYDPSAGSGQAARASW